MKHRKQYKSSPQMLANFARAAEVYKDGAIKTMSSNVPLTDISNRHYVTLTKRR